MKINNIYKLIRPLNSMEKEGEFWMVTDFVYYNKKILNFKIHKPLVVLRCFKDYQHPLGVIGYALNKEQIRDNFILYKIQEQVNKEMKLCL